MSTAADCLAAADTQRRKAESSIQFHREQTRADRTVTTITIGAAAGIDSVSASQACRFAVRRDEEAWEAAVREAGVPMTPALSAMYLVPLFISQRAGHAQGTVALDDLLRTHGRIISLLRNDPWLASPYLGFHTPCPDGTTTTLLVQRLGRRVLFDGALPSVIAAGLPSLRDSLPADIAAKSHVGQAMSVEIGHLLNTRETLHAESLALLVRHLDPEELLFQCRLGMGVETPLTQELLRTATHGVYRDAALELLWRIEALGQPGVVVRSSLPSLLTKQFHCYAHAQQAGKERATLADLDEAVALIARMRGEPSAGERPVAGLAKSLYYGMLFGAVSRVPAPAGTWREIAEHCLDHDAWFETPIKGFDSGNKSSTIWHLLNDDRFGDALAIFDVVMRERQMRSTIDAAAPRQDADSLARRRGAPC